MLVRPEVVPDKKELQVAAAHDLTCKNSVNGQSGQASASLPVTVAANSSSGSGSGTSLDFGSISSLASCAAYLSLRFLRRS